MKRLAIVATVVVGFALTSAPALASESVAASLPDIEDEVMCPICGTILEASNAPQAERQRAFIRARIDSGQDKEQIKAALVDEFGRDVLAVPDKSGFDLLAWVVPIVGFLAATLVLGLALWRIRSKKTASATSPQVDDATDERIRREIADSDL